MANFQTHITTSSLLGVGYAGAGIAHGLPVDACLVAGGLCGISGMLPDLDSDTGVPVRETMAFSAAVVPLFLVHRFSYLELSYNTMVLAGGAIYLFIRFGISWMIKQCTVHRGMFHSLPTAIIFAELGFLVSGHESLFLRCYNSVAILVGFMSHLLLDELYSLEWYHGRLRRKKSFGTAVKLWGNSWWGNLSTYVKLVMITLIVVNEPAVEQMLGTPPGDQLYQTARKLIDSTAEQK